MSPYLSQVAQDAQAMGYGDKSYWDYLERSAFESHDLYTKRGDLERANEMIVRSLSEALRGNDGE